MLQSEGYGGYSSAAERLTVAQDVVGSIPTSRPNYTIFRYFSSTQPAQRAGVPLIPLHVQGHIHRGPVALWPPPFRIRMRSQAVGTVHCREARREPSRLEKVPLQICASGTLGEEFKVNLRTSGNGTKLRSHNDWQDSGARSISSKQQASGVDTRTKTHAATAPQR